MAAASPDIDFVIFWVDGSDPEWQARRAQYAGEDLSRDSGEHRYRDWGLLKYWFRSVEANAPWVRKIHLVTCGQVPDWLERDHPKLHLVNHEDYIPSEYLPTFNSRPIEFFQHRIEGLAEHFVSFNDDMFVAASASPKDFFKDGLPVDIAALNVFCYSMTDPTQLCVVRNVGVVNKYFDMKKALKANRWKWFNLRAGKYLLRTLVLYRSPRFPGFVIHHCAVPYLKSTYKEVWEREPGLLERTCSHRFRNDEDVNHWVMRGWQLASGSFMPASARKYRYLCVDGIEAAYVAADVIRKRDTTHLCLNDSASLAQVDRAAAILRSAFEEMYPAPSSFEKAGLGSVSLHGSEDTRDEEVAPAP